MAAPCDKIAPFKPPLTHKSGPESTLQEVARPDLMIAAREDFLNGLSTDQPIHHKAFADQLPICSRCNSPRPTVGSWLYRQLQATLTLEGMSDLMLKLIKAEAINSASALW